MVKLSSTSINVVGVIKIVEGLYKKNNIAFCSDAEKFMRVKLYTINAMKQMDKNSHVNKGNCQSSLTYGFRINNYQDEGINCFVTLVYHYIVGTKRDKEFVVETIINHPKCKKNFSYITYNLL